MLLWHFNSTLCPPCLDYLNNFQCDLKILGRWRSISVGISRWMGVCHSHCMPAPANTDCRVKQPRSKWRVFLFTLSSNADSAWDFKRLAGSVWKGLKWKDAERCTCRVSHLHCSSFKTALSAGEGNMKSRQEGYGIYVCWLEDCHCVFTTHFCSIICEQPQHRKPKAGINPTSFLRWCDCANCYKIANC